MRVPSRGRFLLTAVLAVAALAALSSFCLALDDESLLTADGTLHVVRIGRAIDLGVSEAISPGNTVIDWSARGQDGTVLTALVPGTDSSSNKRNLQLAFDDQTQTLLVLWTEDTFPYSQVRIGVLHDGMWQSYGLLPNQGLSGAYNPRMVLTHQPVTHIDQQGEVVATTSSILSVIWWEDAQFGQARYAALFLDESGFNPVNLAVYDLPALLGESGETVYGGIPAASFLFPSLQPDGLSGSVLACFTDLHDQLFKVVRIQFPSDQGKPSEAGNLKWQRRHIPIVGVATQGPVARMTPILASGPGNSPAVGTSIGAGYRPTLYWRDADSLEYTRLDDGGWTPVRSIAIDESMPYERALALVIGMGERK
jgi:hypothetical protein